MMRLRAAAAAATTTTTTIKENWSIALQYSGLGTLSVTSEEEEEEVTGPAVATNSR